MECRTRLHVTPLPKKRFQRLCLRKNTNSCPTKSVQFQNKENEHDDMGLSTNKVTNISGRLSSPGYRLEHRTTPTFVTIRRPRQIIPSPLTTSGSNMDSDSSQFVVSGYFSTNSPKSVQKPYLAFSTPNDNNDFKHLQSHNFIDSDKVEIGKTTDSERQRSANFPNGQIKMLKQRKKGLCDDSNTTHNNISTSKTFDMESLNIFVKECHTNSVPDHLKENSYKTPENCTDILRKLTPQTASIMDNLYGDVWKSTPGLFKKSKSRIDPTLKLEKFCVDDVDVIDKLDSLQINVLSTEIKSKHQPAQSSIKRFFKSSNRNIANQSNVTYGEHTKGNNNIKENISKPKEVIDTTYGCLDSKADNSSKNILNESNMIGKRKPKKQIVSENSTTTKIDDAISCKPYHKNLVGNINEGTQTNAIKCDRLIERNKKQNDSEMKDGIKKIKSQRISQTKKDLKLKRTPEINIRNIEKRSHITKPNSNEQIKPTEYKIVINEGIKEQKIKSDKNNFEDRNVLNDADLKKINLSLEMKLNNIADNYSKLQTKFSKPNKRFMNDPIKDSRCVIDIKNSDSLKCPKKLGLSDIKSNKSKSEISNRVTKPPKHKYIQPNEKTKKVIENSDSIVKTKLNSDKDLKIGHKPAHCKNVDAKEIHHEKVNADLFDSLINKETVKINSNLDDSCEILTVRKKKINYFHSSDSDDDSERKLDDLHFDLQPKTLIFESNGNDVDLGKNPKKTVVKKSLKERNSAKSLTVSKANPVSTDTQVYSFMASLADNVPSWRCDPDAKCFKKNFKSKRDELTKKLFIMFNENVFESKLPSDLLIEWSVNLTKTAGRAHNKVIKHRSKPSVPPMITRKSSVELSAKVVDGTQRLRDTLAHELCHVATWLIDAELRDGHGPCWKAWVAKTLKRYPELVALPVCHTLDIHYKYTYKCVKCGYSIGRHSKSIDTTKKRCGYCYGTLECIHNKKNKDGLVISTPVGQKRQATGFALYVKENYGNVRGVNTPHKEAMKYLGKQYAKMKIGNQEALDGK